MWGATTTRPVRRICSEIGESGQVHGVKSRVFEVVAPGMSRSPEFRRVAEWTVAEFEVSSIYDYVIKVPMPA